MAEAREPLFDNSGTCPIRVPGINGVPINCPTGQEGEAFAHAANNWKQYPRLTAREIAMLGVMNALTDKPDWHKKVFDEEIIAKWRGEALAMELISEKAWEWCLAELRNKVELYEKTGRVLVLDAGSRVCKSDTLVSAALQAELKENVKPLLGQEEKDWHPGSDDQVLNLVHPSLFPLVYQQSRVLSGGGQVDLENFLDSCGQGEVAPTKQTEPLPDIGTIRESLRYRTGHLSPEKNYRWSNRFQWLPAEVEFTAESGTDVRFTSYINNLHPRHRPLYRTIEKVVSLAIDPWNDTLVKESQPRNPPRIVTFGAEWEPDYPDWAKGLFQISRNKTTPQYKEARDKVAAYLALPDKFGPGLMEDEGLEDEMMEEVGDDDGSQDKDEEDIEEEWEDDEDEDEDEDERLNKDWEKEHGLDNATEIKWKRLRNVAHPEPGVAFTYEDWKAGRTGRAVVKPYRSFRTVKDDDWKEHTYYDVKIQDTFRRQGVQCIVKLASIELTPDKPTYPGGSWHIEGLLNEHIAATAIYYFDVDNVTETRIAFRTEATFDEMSMVYPQDEHKPLAEIFGIESGRLRDEPAMQELGNISTPDNRLVVFPNTLQHRVSPFELADKSRPGHRRFLVLWLVDPHYRICSTRNVPPQRHDWWAEDGLSKVDFRPLPREVVDMVAREVGEWPMGMEEAKALRLELMKERMAGMAQVEAEFEEYNFCEH